MPDTYRTNYKGHEIVVTLTEDALDTGHILLRSIGKTFALEPKWEFASKDEAIKFALTYCEYRICNPKITLDLQ